MRSPFAPAAAIALLLWAAAVIAAPSTSLSDPAPETAIPGEERQVTIEEMLADMFVLGPPEADWLEDAVDLIGLIEAMPGGGAQNFILTTDETGPIQLDILDPVAGANAVPDGWRLFREFALGGDSEIGGAHTFIPIDARYVLVITAPVEREGALWCTGEQMGTIYERPDRLSDVTVEEIDFLVELLVVTPTDIEMCSRYRRLSPGIFREEIFASGGRPFVNMNADHETIEIVQADEVESLLNLD